jgi:aspartate racemase
MRIAGIIGGIGPESTIEYYRGIIASYRRRSRDGSYPALLLDSIDLSRMVDWFAAGRLADVTSYLLAEIHRLARGGADFALLAANTPHVVFADLQRQSPIPLISIVEATCRAAQAQGLGRVGLLGTRYTMQGRFYPEVFERAGVALVTPSPSEQDYIHDVYLNELLKDVFRPETRTGLLAVVERLKVEEGIEGLILGGTELPLILHDVADVGIPFLDTTQIHVEEVVARLLD